ncbi:MAG: response regulator [Planctomycetes bacterium]|nr:response regulator [Planctomycetota bacterium]
MTERILFVDDEPRVLAAFQRQLNERFDVSTAPDGEAALKLIAAAAPFAVIVSDMRMPGMDGVEFLAAAKRHAPDSVRVMLTGNGDQQTAIEAVNEGHIFRFLNKPCTPESLAQTLEAGIAQYRLVTAEKELLQKTLRGAVELLAEVLSLTNPVAFGHASRVKRLAARLCKHMRVEPCWQIEIAAMLSQIGCVTIPPDTLAKAYRGEALETQELQLLDAHPGVGADLIRHIPRLEEVAGIVAYQRKCFDGSGTPRDDVSGEAIPLGARILKIAADYDQLCWGRNLGPGAILELQERNDCYDPAVLIAFAELLAADHQFELREFTLAEVMPNAVLAEDVKAPDGRLLIAKGQELSPSMCQLLHNFADRQGLRSAIRVRAYVAATPP